jgi:AraC-like DNA-binding protein
MSGIGPIRFVTRHKAHLRRVPPGSRSFRHPHHILALHRIEGGHAGLADERHAVFGAFLALLPAGDLDVNDMVGLDDAWWCAFDGAAISGSRAGARLILHGAAGRVLPRLHRLDVTGARRAAGLFHELRSAHESATPAGELTAHARLADLLAMWLEGGEAPQDDAVEALRGLLERHACQADLSLADLAQRLGRSPEPLSEAFRRRFGRTPVAHRTAVRMQRARELLAQGGMPLAAVAAACGLPDAGYFCRVFRRHAGCTPGQWAQRFAGGD